MGKRGENIYRRKDKRWEGRYIVGRKNDGKPKFRYVYGTTYGQVREILITRKYEQLRASPESNSHTPRNFEDWVRYWMELLVKPNIKVSTYQQYQRVISKHLLPDFGSCALCDITKEMIQHALSRWKETLAPSTAQSVFRILKSILKAGHARQLCGQPWLGIRVAAKSRRPRILSLDEQKRLEKTALNSQAPEIILALYTGLRVGELCALHWSDIDWKRAQLCVRRSVQRLSMDKGSTHLVVGTPKSESSQREIPIPPFLMSRLRALQTGRQNGYILSRSGNVVVDPRTVQARFTKLSKSIGIQGAHMHTLRHTYATRCLEKGIGFEVLSELLGHSSPQITIQCYAHCTEEQKRLAISKLRQLA